MGSIYGKSFIDFPSELAGRITGASITPITTGKSGAEIYKIRKPDKTICYLKCENVKIKHELLSEVRIYDWIDNKIRVPEVLYYDIIDNKEYMLYTEVEGNMANSRIFLEAQNIENLIRIIAKGLKQLHSLSIENCDIDSKLDIKMKQAKKRIENNLVENWDFQEQNKNKSPNDIYMELLNNKPETEDLVFTHGDYCLTNIIIDEETNIGFIDMGRGGIADRYQDIALAIRNIKYNLNLEDANKYIELFFKEYGINSPDIKKIEYYILLDELF